MRDKIVAAIIAMIAVVGVGYLAHHTNGERVRSYNYSVYHQPTYHINQSIDEKKIEGYLKEVHDLHTLSLTLMKVFNESLNPNYPLAIIQTLAEKNNARAYSKFWYLKLTENGSFVHSRSSGWNSENKTRFFVIPYSELNSGKYEDFDFLGGWAYTDMTGKGLLFIYYLAHTQYITGIRDVSVVYPANWSIESSTSEKIWWCQPVIEGNESVMRCFSTNPSAHAWAYGDMKSAGFSTSGYYGSLVIIFDTPYTGKNKPPICVRFELKTKMGDKNSPQLCGIIPGRHY
ncbi:hypothetical protein [Thermococcus sp.]